MTLSNGGSENSQDKCSEAECGRMAGLRKRWIVVAMGVLAIVAGSVAWQMWFPGQAFDPAVWQDESEVQKGVRLGMADWLIARRALLGRTRAEVVEILGEPPSTGYFTDWDVVYWLGRERGLIRIDSEWLVLRLGEDGRVADNRIVRD